MLLLVRTVLDCRLVAGVLPPEVLTWPGEGRSETHLGTSTPPHTLVPAAPRPAAWEKSEYSLWQLLC